MYVGEKHLLQNDKLHVKINTLNTLTFDIYMTPTEDSTSSLFPQLVELPPFSYPFPSHFLTAAFLVLCLLHQVLISHVMYHSL